MRLPVLALAGLLLVPAVAAAPTDLFLHVHGFQDMPMNTQEPPEDYQANAALGVATSTLTCLPPVPGQTITANRYHTWYGYPSANLVGYGLDGEQNLGNGKPRIYPMRGLAANVTLLEVPVLHWYLSTDAAPTSGGAEPTVVPRLVVAAALRTGSELRIDEESYERGELLAKGRTVPVTLAGSATQGAEWSRVNGRDVYGFQVPLPWVAAPVLTPEKSFNLQVEVFMDLPGCDQPGQNVMVNSVAVHSSPGHRPRLLLQPGPTLEVTSFRTVENATWTAFVAEVTSAWGAYDVALGNATMTLEGPNGERLPLERLFIVRAHEHGEETRPAEVAWRYDGPLPAGVHRATVRVHDLQHPDQPAEATLLLGAAEQPVPGPALPMLALALAAAALLARRK